MPTRFLRFWSLPAILLSVQVAGCSAVGYRPGGAIDRSVGAPRPLTRYAIVEVRPGATLTVQTTDGTTVSRSRSAPRAAPSVSPG